MDKNKSAGKLWRLTKVLYFIITIPLVGLGAGALLLLQEINRGSYSSGIWINDYYIGSLYMILFLISYILLTDLIRRIISYINNGTFNGFIPYIEILKRFSILIIIIGGIISVILISLSQNLRNECTGNNEGFNDYGVCNCYEGYIRENGSCKITLEKTILNVIPYGSFLREYKEIPGENGVYIGIYIKNYEILSEGKQEYGFNGEKMPLYSDCFGNVEGQGIKGEYYLFSFKDGRILNEKEVPVGFRFNNISNNSELPKLTFSYYNTKYNNSYYFLKKEVEYNDENNFSIEKTSLINFSDYNGDGIKNEFFLVDHWDQVCGHNNYLIAGYDNKTNGVIIYGIKSKDGTTGYWGDNFIPDTKGEVVNGWNCGDHGSDTLNKTYYKFNKENNIFEYVKNENRNCTENDYK
ncbi:hypothetical protein HUU51_04830 [Candidatus Gracilibacteria bacterium]|nr:hypothetical protein [Candidatus Gracilibacteria bacterium]